MSTIFLTILETFKIFLPAEITLKATIQNKFSKSSILSRETSEVDINFTNLLNSMGGVVSVGAWVRGWREPNFGVSRVGCVGLQKFGAG